MTHCQDVNTLGTNRAGVGPALHHAHRRNCRSSHTVALAFDLMCAILEVESISVKKMPADRHRLVNKLQA